MLIKHIFTNDDEKTMEWAQKLGGKKPFLLKLSHLTLEIQNKSYNLQVALFLECTGEGLYETNVDLIPIKPIRELPTDEQFVFYTG